MKLKGLAPRVTARMPHQRSESSVFWVLTKSQKKGVRIEVFWHAICHWLEHAGVSTRPELQTPGTLVMKETRTRNVVEALPQVHRTLFDRHPHAVLVIDAAGDVHTSNAAAQWLARGSRVPALNELMLGTPPHALRRSLVERCEWSGSLDISSADGFVRLVEAHLIPIPRQEDDPQQFLLILERMATPQRVHEAGDSSDNRFRLIAETAPSMIWLARVDGAFDWFNPLWSSFTGLDSDQLKDKGWLDLIHPDDQARCDSVFKASFEAQQPFDLDFRLRRHDGEYRWVLDTGVPRHGPDGSFRGFIGCCVDIHERKLLEQRLAEHTQTLRLADRRQGEFLAMLSHEMRNPLAPIANAASVLRSLEDDNPTLGRLREILERQVGRLRRLVDDLADVIRVMQGQITLTKERVALGDLVHAAVENIQHKLDANGHTLQIDLPQTQLYVDGDSVRLAQLLSNILYNAAKFTAQPNVISLSARLEERMLLITIKDPGQGIAPEFLPHVFELFSQAEASTPRSHGGLGVGLPMSRRIAQLHGGDVRAFSEGPGRGAEFVVSLPLAGRLPAQSNAAPPTLPAVPALRVLIIEDNHDSRYLLRLQMEMWGHEVLTASHAEEGLGLCESFNPHIVLCDLGLRGTDGFQLIQPMRKQLAHRPVLFAALTGYGRDEDESRALAAGFDAFLLKPLRPDSLNSLFQTYARRVA